MDLFNSMKVAAAGLKAQAGRMRVIAENLANANSTAQAKGQEPYRRKIPTFVQEFDKEIGATLVKNGRIKLDKTDFGKRYSPGHPAADDKGYIQTPNVNTAAFVTASPLNYLHVCQQPMAIPLFHPAH